jgi:hypothetical protein
LRPNLIHLSPITPSSERVAEASLLPSQPRSRQPEARAGPPGRTG